VNNETRTVKIVTVATALAAVLLVCALAATADASGLSDTDDAAVRDNVKQMETGWNRKSGALFAKPFAEDADYVVVNGLHIRGRAAIAEGHQRIFDTFYKNTTIALAVEHVRLLRADVALVHARGRLTDPRPDDPARSTEARMTLVMSKDQTGWHIVAFQNTQIARQ